MLRRTLHPAYRSYGGAAFPRNNKVQVLTPPTPPPPHLLFLGSPIHGDLGLTDDSCLPLTDLQWSSALLPALAAHRPALWARFGAWVQWQAAEATLVGDALTAALHKDGDRFRTAGWTSACDATSSKQRLWQ